MHPESSELRVVLLIFDRLTLVGLTEELKSAYNICVAGSYMRLADLIAASNVLADVIVIGPYKNGAFDLESVRQVRLLFPAISILVYSERFLPHEFLHTMLLGVNGYVLKDNSDVERLKHVLKQLGEGHLTVLDARVAEYFQCYGDQYIVLARGTDFQILSPKELEVIALMSLGYSDQQIALQLGVQTTTVRTHIERIINKLGVPNRFLLGVRTAPWLTEA